MPDSEQSRCASLIGSACCVASWFARTNSVVASSETMLLATEVGCFSCFGAADADLNIPRMDWSDAVTARELAPAA